MAEKDEKSKTQEGWPLHTAGRDYHPDKSMKHHPVGVQNRDRAHQTTKSGKSHKSK